MRFIPILFSLILLIPVGITHADYEAGNKWFCNPDRPEYERTDYEQSIRGYNEFADRYLETHSGEDMIDSGLYGIGQQAECIKVVHGIEPDSVAKFSPKVIKVFEANMDDLIETAPNLVQYATVPEFGSIAMLILVTSIIAVIVSTRKLNVVK